MKSLAALVVVLSVGGVVVYGASLGWFGEGRMDWHQLQGQVLLRQLQLEKPGFGQLQLLRQSAAQLQNQHLTGVAV